MSNAVGCLLPVVELLPLTANGLRLTGLAVVTGLGCFVSIFIQDDWVQDSADTYLTLSKFCHMMGTCCESWRVGEECRKCLGNGGDSGILVADGRRRLTVEEVPTGLVP